MHGGSDAQHFATGRSSSRRLASQSGSRHRNLPGLKERTGFINEPQGNVGIRIRLAGNIAWHNWQPEWGELIESKLAVGDEPVVSFDTTRSKHFLWKDDP